MQNVQLYGTYKLYAHLDSEPIWSWWIGTNCGHIYIYSIISSSSESSDLILTCSPVVRHIQLKHRAPLINIIFLNGQNQPLNETITGIDEPAQKVLLCSEEQVKVNLMSLTKF